MLGRLLKVVRAFFKGHEGGGARFAPRAGCLESACRHFHIRTFCAVVTARGTARRTASVCSKPRSQTATNRVLRPELVRHSHAATIPPGDDVLSMAPVRAVEREQHGANKGEQRPR
jgi:hypothetical protein